MYNIRISEILLFGGNMASSYNDYIRGAPTPPPPPLRTEYTDNQEIKKSVRLTPDQSLHFDENMERLNNILARVESLIGLAKDNPDILVECSSLMRSAADIDLPSEIKNQKIATCPSVVQELYKQVQSSGSSQSISQIAKDLNINMQIQQNLQDAKSEEARNIQHYKAMAAIDDALASNKPITTQMICDHCRVMKEITNTDLHGLAKSQELMQKFLSATTPEERMQVFNEMRKDKNEIRRCWEKRKHWHKTTTNLLNSDRELTSEQLGFIDESLREEEELARKMLRQARELRQLAETAEDEATRKGLLKMADSTERYGYDILSKNKETRRAFNNHQNRSSSRSNNSSQQGKTTTSRNQSVTRNQNVTRNQTQEGGHEVGQSQQMKKNDSANELMTAASPEERQKILDRMQLENKNNWNKHKKWHKSMHTALDSGIEMSSEELKTIQSSLKEEERVGKQMLKKAQNLRQKAENEPDEQQRDMLSRLAQEVENSGYDLLAENKITQRAYNQRVRGRDDNYTDTDRQVKQLNKLYTSKDPSECQEIRMKMLENDDKIRQTTVNRQKWHKSTASLLASDKEVSSEQLNFIKESLKEEEAQAKQMVKRSQDLVHMANREQDPQKRAELLLLAQETETRGNATLQQMKSTREAYDTRVENNRAANGISQPTVGEVVNGNATEVRAQTKAILDNVQKKLPKLDTNAVARGKEGSEKLAEQNNETKNAQKGMSSWWHNVARTALNSTKDISQENLKSIDSNLSQEAVVAHGYIKSAEEFKAQAKEETNPQKRRYLLNISDSLEAKGYGMLFENKQSRIAYNNKTKEYDNPKASDKPSETVSEKPKDDKASQKTVSTVSEDKPKEDPKKQSVEAPKTPKTSQQTKTNQNEQSVDENKTQSDQKQTLDNALTLKLKYSGQEVIFLDEENDNLYGNYNYSVLTMG